MYPKAMEKKKIHIINGPNLNRLGRRSPAIYGTTGMEECLHEISVAFTEVETKYFQSNCEGEIIDCLQRIIEEGDSAGVIINPGAYAHYSYAIADALADLRENGVKVVEVHISNIASREEFRRTSVTAAQCTGYISGLGMKGYSLALRYLLGKG